MYLIWGSMPWTSTRGEGEFYCPRCDCKRLYSRRQCTRYFTLFFVPLFPLERLPQHVECASCANTYALEVLSFDPQLAAAEAKGRLRMDIQRSLLRSLAGMMLTRSSPTGPAVGQICTSYKEVTGEAITPAEVLAIALALPFPSGGPAALVGSAVRGQSEKLREAFLTSAIALVWLHDDVSPEEDAFLTDLANCLEVDRERLEELLVLHVLRHPRSSTDDDPREEDGDSWDEADEDDEPGDGEDQDGGVWDDERDEPEGGEVEDESREP